MLLHCPRINFLQHRSLLRCLGVSALLPPRQQERRRVQPSFASFNIACTSLGGIMQYDGNDNEHVETVRLVPVTFPIMLLFRLMAS